MSMAALRWCRPLRVTATEKAVLWALADQADDRGEAWPSIAGLVEATCLSERSVQGAVAGLRSRGLLTTETGGGRHKTTTYRLHLDVAQTPHEPRGNEGQNRARQPRETPQQVHDTAQDVRGIALTETPQDVHETPQQVRETPQDVRETPQELHPNPHNPQEPSGTLKVIVRARDLVGDPFEGWWQHYPRKVGKDAARRAYAAARKRGASDAVLAAGLSRQRWPDDPKFIPHPATWLNGGRWQDDPNAAAPAPAEPEGPWWADPNALTPRSDARQPFDIEATAETAA